MKDGWTKLRIRDIAESMGDAPFGSALKNKDYTDSGALVVQGKNIQGKNCDWSDRRYVSLEKYRTLPRSHCYPGDLVFPKVGTIGKVGFLTPFGDQKKYILSTNTMRLRVNEEIASQIYVYQYFSSPDIVNLIQAMNSKSVQPVFNFTSLRDFEIPLPPLPIQRRIADILGALDDKIECNRRMNQTLEAMAQALYKHWFVDYAPIRDGEFVDSELGRIPQGWEVNSLSNCCVLLSGGTPSTSIAEYWNGDIPWVSARDVSQKDQIYIMKTERKITPLGIKNSATKILPQNTVVVVARGSVGEFAMLGSDMAMNQTSYGLRGKNGIGQPWVYLTVSNVMNRLKQAAYGTVFDTITTATFQQLKIALPPDNILGKFENKISPLFAQIHSNARENQTLTRTRDYLLPKLLSGEVEVKAAELKL